VENPAAYEAAIQGRIKHNAYITRSRNFKRDHPELHQVLTDVWHPEWAADQEEWQSDGSHLILHTITFPERKALLRKLAWLYDGYEEYGSLTDGQLVKAEEIIQEVRERQTKYAAEDAERLANAEPWPEAAGRVEYPVEIISAKLKEVPSFNPYDRFADYQWKIVVQREDGSRAWGSAPRALLDEIAERVDYHDWDDTFARHLRGVRFTLRATFEPKHEDPLFAFFKRPHVVSIAKED